MSSILRMLSKRSAAVAQSFGARAESYEAHADLQRAISDKLADLLPPLARPSVLELGCGTGLFSRHLLGRYPDGTFLFTDLAPSMIDQCRRNMSVAVTQSVSFEVTDAARPPAQGPFDLIASSMTLHWLTDPVAALAALCELLAPRGVLIYATVGGKSFPEWREALAQRGLPIGIPDIPELPGVVAEERVSVDADALGFLHRLRSIGGLIPREGYSPLSAGALRRTIRTANEKHGGRITWHIVYGRLAASQSNPSISPA
jgi:malonyl-CoA O-methyltransferase